MCDVVITDLQPSAVYVVEGDAVQLNCSLSSSAGITCPESPLNLSDVNIRRFSTDEALNGQLQLIGAGVAQFTLDTMATVTFNRITNVYCSLGDVTGNTTVDSQPATIDVLSQYFVIQTVSSLHELQTYLWNPYS